MPTETILYGVKTAFSAAANLASLPAGQAAALGAVSNTSFTPATGYKIEVNFTAGPAAGTVDILLIESLDGTLFTDGIAGNAAPNVAGAINNAVRVHTCNVASAGQVINDRFDLPVLHAPRNWALVARNNTAGALSSSGATAFYLPVNYGA